MSIIYNSENKIFFLEGKNTTYSFFINSEGYAEHLYYGKKIGRDDITYTRGEGTTASTATPPGKDNTRSYLYNAPELSFFGTSDYREPTVLVQNQDGSRLSDLLYAGHEIIPEKPPINGMPSMSGGETLVLHLKDSISSFAADLYYTVYDDCDVIARRTVYINGGASAVTLKRAYSFAFALPSNDYDMLSLYGGWARERQIERVSLHHGITSVDSKRASSSATLNPFIAITDKNTDETHGEAYGFSLVYSSSFVLKAEVASTGETLVTGGINDFDFSWKLSVGETLETPEIIIAYSAEGLGAMSRAFHTAFRNHLINPRYVNKERPLLINNWEATYMKFDNERLMAIIDAVEGTGIDTFVLDDGWFGKRNSDNAGLGDWFVNEEKLKGGLKTIIDYVHKKGMKFGLWFEPEMINEDSELYRTHPDYVIKAPNRPMCYSRHQYMLDLTRSEVRDYVVNSVNKVLAENEIEYVKWDYNRNVTEFFSIGRDAERQSEFSHRYALGLYDICERIVNANPEIFFEGCASGGARFDPAMLYYFPQIWTSDDTDAEERTRIQYGTSLVYPISAMSCHVSVCPNHQTSRITPFDTRAKISHLGATGYELDASKFTADEKAAVAKQVAEYKEDERLIMSGELFRIDDPYKTNYFTEAIVSQDKSSAILLTYRSLGRPNSEIKRVKMVGLDPDKKYYVRELDRTLSGRTLMGVGMVISYPNGDFTCRLYHFEER